MEYYLPLAIAATTMVVYSIANYLSSPITPLLKQLGRTNKDQPLTQLQHYNLVTQLKTTEETQQLLPTTTTTTTIDPNPIVVALLRSNHGLPEQDPAFLTMLPKIQTLVHSLQLETLALHHLEQLQQTTFNKHNPLHRQLLDSLWGLLVPDTVREQPLDKTSNHNALASPSWSTIGFQGKDPTTDFRGMALLGLFQLVHFSCSRHSATTLCLSQAPKEGPEVKFFPFACAGIQITHLVLTLARERLLGFVVGQGHRHPPWSDGKEHQMARDAQAHMKTVVNQMKGVQDSNDKDLIWDSVLLLNDVYSEIFILLGEEWEKENPPDVMSFGPIFKKVELKIRAQLSAGVEHERKGKGGACSNLEIRWRR
jgi:hypothetical protein